MKCLAFILAGVLLGNGSIYVFNTLPAGWLCDYGEKPTEEMLDPYTQRIKGYPWRYIFTMFFVASGLWLGTRDWLQAIPTLLALWLLVEMGISDWKYRIIPDQFVVLLALTSLGFLNRSLSWRSGLLGMVTGLLLMGAIALVGKLAYKRMAIGGGDIKLFAALGLITGVAGILTVFVLATLLSAIHYAVLLARGRKRKGEAMPYAPYVAAASAVYFLFLRDYMGIFVIQ